MGNLKAKGEFMCLEKERRNVLIMLFQKFEVKKLGMKLSRGKEPSHLLDQSQ